MLATLITECLIQSHALSLLALVQSCWSVYYGVCADEGDTRLLTAPTAGGALLLVVAGQQMTVPTAGGALLVVVAGQQRAG